MPDLAERSPAVAVRSLGALALAAADRYQGDFIRAPGRAAISFPDFGRAIREIAGGLASLGIGTGDRVAILAGTVPEWTLADFGALCAGAIGRDRLPHQLARGVRVRARAFRREALILLEDAAQAAKIAKIRGGLPELEHVVVLDRRGRRRDHARRPARARAPRTATPSPASASRRSPSTTRRRSSTPRARPARRRAACSRTRTCSTTTDAYIDRLAPARVAAGHLPLPAARARAGPA